MSTSFMITNHKDILMTTIKVITYTFTNYIASYSSSWCTEKLMKRNRSATKFALLWIKLASYSEIESSLSSPAIIILAAIVPLYLDPVIRRSYISCPANHHASS